MENKNLIFKVAVRCMTFNHSKYITDAMNGFTMQQTDFPFVCMIVDDASIDGEQEVIEKYVSENFDVSPDGNYYEKDTDYAHIIFAQHKTNENCYFAVLLLKENHYSKKKSKDPYLSEWQDDVDYIAYCEGDDYWIEKSKLYKQVQILNDNPDVSMVYTNFKTVDKDGKDYYWRGVSNKFPKCATSGNIFFQLLNEGTFVSTHSCCIRKNVIYCNYYKFAPNKIDYNLFLAASLIGKVYYINEIMGCYRKTPGSAVNAHHSEVNRMLEDIFRYYILTYLSNKQIAPNGYETFLVKKKALRIAIRELVHGNRTFFLGIISRSPMMSFYIPFIIFEIFFAKIFRMKFL